MKYAASQKGIITISIAIALVLSLGRLARKHFDSSYFIVAGSDYVNTAKTPSPIIVQPGQGYDGQFFYRYALNPFDLHNPAYGINVDHPSYRVQRIGYPLLAWLLSLGGTPALVPWALLCLNILAFAGIFFYTNKFIEALNGDSKQGLLPLLLCGIYMSLSRDLSEVTELFFFTGCIYYACSARYFLFSVFALFTILSRETSMIALAPLSLCVLIRKENGNNKTSRLFYVAIPFFVFIAWKMLVYTQIPSLTDTTAGYRSVGMPFKGIIQGFNENYNFSDKKHTLQFLFWTAYLLWMFSLVVIVLWKGGFKKLTDLTNTNILKIIYLMWLLFAICFSDNIYGDDWGFVRIFSLWSMTGFMILIAEKKKTPALFNLLSAMLVLLTLARLIIRV